MVKISRDAPGLIVCHSDLPPVVFAAEQLAYYVALLTGAHPRIIRNAGKRPQKGGKEARRGASGGTEGPAVHLALVGKSEANDEEEKCEFVVDRQQAYLTATTPFALLHGVYKILERFGGVRWLNRLEADEFVPRMDALEFPDGRYFWRARFDSRAFTNYPYIGPQTADFLDWMAKNGYNVFMVNASVKGAWETARQFLLDQAALRGIEITLGHHTFDFWLPAGEFFETHPEYFALIDGQRRPDGQLCTTNPEVRRIVAERIVAFLQENPGVREVGLWPKDGYGWCQCDRCAAEEEQRPSWWSASQPRRTDTYLKFVNAVAEMVAERQPEARITGLAYVNYAEPPQTVWPSDNVVIYFAPFQRCFKHPLGDPECRRRNTEYAEMIQKWAEVAPGRLRLFSYLMQIDTLSLPYRLTRMLPANFEFMQRAGVSGWVMEYDEREWATFGANAYLIGRLGWETDDGVPEDGEKWLAEMLYPPLYGDAAADMAEYFGELIARMVQEGPCTGHYDLAWVMRATPGYLNDALAALGRARAAAARDKKAWRAVERAAIAAELLLRVGQWQRAMADLAEANDFTRPRRVELAELTAREVIEWAEKWAESGAVNAEKVAERVRRETERAAQQGS